MSVRFMEGLAQRVFGAGRRIGVGRRGGRHRKQLCLELLDRRTVPAVVLQPVDIPAPVQAHLLPGLADMVGGADGNLWLAESYPAMIVRMTPKGDFTEFALPSSSTPIAGSAITGLVTGPDGDVW